MEAYIILGIIAFIFCFLIYLLLQKIVPHQGPHHNISYKQINSSRSTGKKTKETRESVLP